MRQKAQPISRTLPNGKLALLDGAFMFRYFTARIPRWYPGHLLADLRIHDHSHLLYKKSIAYRLTLKDAQNASRHVVLLRGNVPSLHTTIEAHTADRALRAIGRSGAAKDLPISRSRGYDEHLRILLYEEVPGETLTSVLQRSPRAGLPCVAQAGRWLARLHTANIRSGRHRGVRREHTEAYFFSLNYGQYYPPCQPKANRIMEKFFALRERFRVPIEREARLLHGDFGPKNIIVDKNRESLTVIDFGNAWRYDPMSDLANALIQLEYIDKATSATIRQARRAFLRSYVRVFPLSGTRRGRLHLFTAWWSLQTLSFIFTLPFTTHYADLARASFRRAERALRNAH